MFSLFSFCVVEKFFMFFLIRNVVMFLVLVFMLVLV